MKCHVAVSALVTFALMGIIPACKPGPVQAPAPSREAVPYAWKSLSVRQTLPSSAIDSLCTPVTRYGEEAYASAMDALVGVLGLPRVVADSTVDCGIVMGGDSTFSAWLLFHADTLWSIRARFVFNRDREAMGAFIGELWARWGDDIMLELPEPGVPRRCEFPLREGVVAWAVLPPLIGGDSVLVAELGVVDRTFVVGHGGRLPWIHVF